MSSESRAQQWLEQSRIEWNDRAGFFDELSARNAAGDDRKAELDFVASALHLRPGSRVLDAGCGPGHFAIAFAQRGCIVDGVDLSDEMIERARANAAAAGVSIRFSIGDLASLDAPDDAYDAIEARMVLQFSPHLSAVLNEFERVAAPNARLWLSVPGSLAPMYRDSWKRFVEPNPPTVTYLVPWELIRLVEERGWTIHEQWGSFDNVVSQRGKNDNVASDLDTAALPLPLQQAAATVWNLIVSPSS